MLTSPLFVSMAGRGAEVCLRQYRLCAQVIPEYANAQKRLDKYVADWQKELADKAAEIEAMRADYEQESYLLPDNLKKRRQEEIKAKEQEIATLQQQFSAPVATLTTQARRAAQTCAGPRIRHD